MDNIEDLMDNELKEIYDEVKAELIELSKNSELEAFTELDESIINSFCDKHNIVIMNEFKEQAKTPFALAKYILLSIQSEEIIKKVDTELSNLLDKEKIEWLIYKNFSNQIHFTKILEINSDEKPQGLLVKYRLDQDTDTIIYTILAGNWGWDINKYELQALLNNKIVPKITKSENTNNVAFTSSMSENKIEVSAGNIKITIKKE